MKYAVICEGSSKTGSGHVARQVALANHAKDHGINSLFLSNSEITKKLCQPSGHHILPYKDVDEILAILEKEEIRALLIDVHQKEFPEYALLSSYRYRAISIVSDVGYTFQYFTSEVIKIGSDTDHWQLKIEESDPQFGSINIHTGRSWTVFREEFANLNASSREKGSILIAHGGTDPFQLTSRTLRALEFSKYRWKVFVMATSSFSDFETISQLVSASKHECLLFKDAKNVAAIMNNSSIAVINGGNIRYECCITQTPYVAISYQPQQYECTALLSNLGVGINLGLMSEVSDELIANSVDELLQDQLELEEQREKMGRLFDLKGGERILKLLFEEL